MSKTRYDECQSYVAPFLPSTSALRPHPFVPARARGMAAAGNIVHNEYSFEGDRLSATSRRTASGWRVIGEDRRKSMPLDTNTCDLLDDWAARARRVSDVIECGGTADETDGHYCSTETPDANHVGVCCRCLCLPIATVTVSSPVMNCPAIGQSKHRLLTLGDNKPNSDCLITLFSTLRMRLPISD